jgi:hypothetical protein
LMFTIKIRDDVKLWQPQQHTIQCDVPTSQFGVS